MWEWFQTLTGQMLFLDIEILLIAWGYLHWFNPPQWLTWSYPVFAYYERNRALLVALLFLLAANLSAIVGIVATSLPQAQFETNDIPMFHSGSCIGTNIPLKFSSFWYVVNRSVSTWEQCWKLSLPRILPLATHSVVTILTMMKYFKTKIDRSSTPPLLRIFVRDHTWVFVLTFGPLWPRFIIVSLW